MKKVLIIILSFFFTISLMAQNQATPYYGFRLGLTAHPNFGFIKAENGEGRGTDLGFAYGIMADFNFAEHYSFNTGITITTINGKSTELNVRPFYNEASNTGTVAYDLKYKMQYIEIPLVLKLKTAKIGDLKWYGQFGLSNDFRIGSRMDAESGPNVYADNNSASSWTRFYRAGIIIGGGAEYDIDSRTSLMAGLTLNNGFTNIATGRNKVRNHYVALNIGVFF